MLVVVADFCLFGII